MIGAIFAGGYGKRLASSTSNTPKALLPLKDDYLILDKQLLDFKNAGIREAFFADWLQRRKDRETLWCQLEGIETPLSKRARANGNPMGTH